MEKMLIIVDPQMDFIEGGSLPVPGAQQAMNALAQYLLENGHQYACKVVTCDWHPHDHRSFQAQGGGWPLHCVQHTVGAAVYPPIADALYASDGPVEILTKGNEQGREEYSIFQNAASARRIDELVKKFKIDYIEICGLAGDVCVLNTYDDACRIYGKQHVGVLQEFSPSLDGGAKLSSKLQEK
ncbi:MAG: isochorismatase family protein [Bacteroidales bacterium]|nr:isochorismatase family protein [Bacteroidales bacterium]